MQQPVLHVSTAPARPYGRITSVGFVSTTCANAPTRSCSCSMGDVLGLGREQTDEADGSCWSGTSRCLPVCCPLVTGRWMDGSHHLEWMVGWATHGGGGIVGVPFGKVGAASGLAICCCAPVELVWGAIKPKTRWHSTHFSRFSWAPSWAPSAWLATGLLVSSGQYFFMGSFPTTTLFDLQPAHLVMAGPGDLAKIASPHRRQGRP